MQKCVSAVLVTLVVLGVAKSARSAAEGDAKALVDKAIKALGGEAKLKKVKGVTWKTKGKANFQGNETDFTTQATVAGLDRIHSQFESEFGGNPFKVVLVLDGDKGWVSFGQGVMELDAENLAREKRNVYLQLVPMTLLPLTGKDFQVEAAGEAKVGDADANVVKIKAPDGKDFELSLDKTSGLPLRMVAKVTDFTQTEFTQETTYGEYKDFGGIKKATKITTKRDGEPFIEAEIIEFKLLEEVDDKTFAEPK
ncbi:MAG TPA: hypothetical protein VGX76_25005 [Pirellulales bacterium]|jgi:hypothetical protein|nr:hypothetical protein [Pirellulales bacterium]